MPAPDPRLLSDYALRMRNGNPEAFELFVRELRRLSEHVTVAVTEADAGSILVAQGRAQQCRSLLRVFEECDRPKPPTP